MKSSNEYAIELQSKFDYFVAASILASMGFAIQLNIIGSKITFILYVLSLVFLGLSAVFCFYRLQQKPHIYHLHSCEENLITQEKDDFRFQLKKAITKYEKMYKTSYFFMVLFFGMGAFTIAIAKLSAIYFQINKSPIF